MPPDLPNPVTVITGLFSSLFTYLQFKSIRATISALVDVLWALISSLMGMAIALADIFRNVKLSWFYADGWLKQIGGDVQGIGIDTWALFHHLRYVLMPATINWVFAWILVNWIWPLRDGLAHTIGWAGRWHWYLLRWILDNRAYTRQIQVSGRDWRSAYVYPQLAFLLSPWRLAYWYAQAITVNVARYLNWPGHSETRDTISRVVYSSMPRLWRVFDRHLVEWLMTDVSSYGFGSDVPGIPGFSLIAPPGRAPDVFEPFISEPAEPPYPAGVPDVPRVDWVF